MNSWAQPGVKCVCIVPTGAWVLRGVPYSTDVVAGRKFTIANVKHDDGWVGLGLWGYPIDEWYDVQGFRPLTAPTLEQDLELFTPLLASKSPYLNWRVLGKKLGPSS